jgi:hypothetical protein
MTRVQIRALLQRQLQEPVGGDQWTDVELNDALNHGLAMVEKEVLKVLPEAFSYFYHIDTEANKNAYPLPTDFISVHQVKFLEASSGKYVRATGYQHSEIDSEDQPAGNCWAILGRYLYVSPTPTVAATNGIRLLFTPTLTMAEDTDTPEVPTVLHAGIALYAKALLTEETGEPSDTTVAALVRLCADLPLWWKPSVPGHFSIEGV